MKKPFFRQLLAAVLVGILAGAPVSPVFAQDPATPAQTPTQAAPPVQALQPAKQGGISNFAGCSQARLFKGSQRFP